MGSWPFGHPSPRDSAEDGSQAAPGQVPPSSTQPPFQRTPSPAEHNHSHDQDGYDHDEDNPFIAFRRTVDAHFRLLASGLSTIPSILQDLQARGEDDSTSPGSSSPDSRWAHDSFAGRADQPLAFLSQHFESPKTHGRQSAPPPSDEAFDATRVLLLQSREACARAGVHPSTILRLYRDPESAHPFFTPSEPTWLSVRWFRKSSYSPSSLETHPITHQHGSMWRAAFEDLLSASTGREPVAREAWTGTRPDQTLYDNWAQTPRDWMLGLQCRGLLPPQLPGLYRLRCTRQMDHVFSGLLRGAAARELGPWGQAARRDFIALANEVGTVDADEQPQQPQQPQSTQKPVQAPPQIQTFTHKQEQEQRQEEETTELDAYEHFLGKASSGNHIPATAAGQTLSVPVPQPQQQHEEESPLMSTLSTTERTTLPDGSVTTRVVLRKRFADGREECTETVSTTLAQEEKGDQGVTVEGREEKKGDKKNTGWFWR